MSGSFTVRLILDGTVVRVRLDRRATSIVLLVVLGARDGQKVLLAVKIMAGETSEAWRAVLDDLVKRGLRKPQFLIVDLRRRIYVKAKAEPTWRFWGLYVHVCKMETLRAAYAMAKQSDGAPGVDGVTFEAIEAQGVEALLEQLRDELTGRTYKPLPARRQAIPKDGGKVRVLSIPATRDRRCKARSSSYSNLSSRRISNRDRLDIGPSGQHMKRSSEWLKR